MIKRIFQTVIFLIITLASSAQSKEGAIRLMNEGKYNDARLYLEAINDNGRYAKLIQSCKECQKLQIEAIQLKNRQQYTNAIEKYNQILRNNPLDKHATDRIKDCERLRANYIKRRDATKAQTELRSYTNTEYGYSIQYPSLYSLSDTYPNTVKFISSNGGTIEIICKIYDGDNTNAHIRSDRISRYNSSANISYQSIDNNGYSISLSGSIVSSIIKFYEKSFIVDRKNQYGETIKLIITARAEKVGRIDDSIISIINKSFEVVGNYTIPIKVAESDYSRWQKAKSKGTIEALNNYIKYAPQNSYYRLLATDQLAIMKARKYYSVGDYNNARLTYLSVRNGWTETDTDNYWESTYYCSLSGLTQIVEMEELINKINTNVRHLISNNKLHLLHTHYNAISVIRGCIVKKYCQEKNFYKARNYVKSYKNKSIWFDEDIAFSKSRWRKYIKQQEILYYSEDTKSNINK